MKYLYYALISVTLMGAPAVKAGVILRKKVMTYDIFNRQTSSTIYKPDANGVLQQHKREEHTYRGDKWHRASTTDMNGSVTRYLYDGDNVLADLDANGNVKRSYVTPTLDGNVSFTTHGGTNETLYYNADERQSIRNLSDSNGVVVQEYDYTAFGDAVDELTKGDVQQRYTYTGRELNDVSGDYYFRYRTYGAGIGGFLMRDPLDDGYTDGMSQYLGYFAIRMSTDPEGLALYLCEDPALWGLINHAYLYDTTTKKGCHQTGIWGIPFTAICGKGKDYYDKNPPTDPANNPRCRRVKVDEKTAKRIMEDCEKNINLVPIFIPGIWDCHTNADKCIRRNSNVVLPPWRYGDKPPDLTPIEKAKAQCNSECFKYRRSGSRNWGPNVRYKQCKRACMKRKGFPKW